MKCPYCGHWMTLTAIAEDGSAATWMCLGRYPSDLFYCGATLSSELAA